MNGHPNKQEMKFHSSQTGPLPANDNMFTPSMGMWPGNVNPNMMMDPSIYAKMQQMQSGNMPSTGMQSAALNMLMLQQMNAALLTQSMDSAGEVSHSVGSDDVSFTTSGLNNMLMGMNIPTSNFTKAMNFETIAATDRMLKDEDEDNGDEFEEEIECESPDEQGMTVQSLDTSSDLLEQQQTQQQSTLLAKFKQLREWQQKQQELLMVQQQQQLDMLREEQERVQKMVAKQREMQWGVSNGINNGLTSTMPDNSTTTSPRKSQERQMLSNTSKTMVPRNGVAATGQFTSLQTQPTLPTMKPGRPVPTFPHQHQNGHMLQQSGHDYHESDSDDVSQHSLTEEGVYPLPDSATKNKNIANFKFRPGQISHNQLLGGNTLIENSSDIQGRNNNAAQFQNFEMRQNGHVSSQLDYHSGTPRNLEEEGDEDDEDIENVSEIYQQRFEEEGKSRSASTNRHFVNPNSAEVFGHGARSIPNTDGLDFRETQHLQSQWFSGNTNTPPRDMDSGAYDQGSEEEYYEESGDEDDVDESCHCEERETAGFDDMPVSGIGGKKKTFEELLEEELRKEEERQRQGSNSSQSQQPAGPKNKQFLRRGEGIARFANGTAGRRPPPKKRRVRSRSRGPVKNIAEKPECQDPKPSKVPTGGSGDGSNEERSKMSPRMETQTTHGLPPKGTRKVNSSNTVGQNPSSKNTKPNSSQQKRLPAPSQRQVNKPSPKSQAQPQMQQIKRLVLNKPSKVMSTMKGGETTPEPRLASDDPLTQPTSVQDTPSKYSDISSLGETSFQARLTARAEMEVFDEHDLHEFELLEQYADGNASFLSNASAVKKVVQQTKGANSGMPQKNLLRKAEHRKVKASSELYVPQTDHRKDAPISKEEVGVEISDTENENDDYNDGTSISSDFDEDTKECEKEQKEDDLDNTLVDSPDGKMQSLIDNGTNISQSHYPKQVQRKVAGKNLAKQTELNDLPLRRNLLASVQQFSDSDAETRNSAESNVFSDGDEDHSDNVFIGAKQAYQKNQLQHNNINKPMPSADLGPNEIDMHFYQPGERYIETTDDERSVSDVLNQKRTPDGNDPVAAYLDFNDEDAWNESQCENERETPTPTSTPTSTSNQVIRKSILNRETAIPNQTLPDPTPTVPPTSQLVGKLFPKLKPDKPKSKMEPKDEERLSHARDTEQSEGIQSKQLRDKLMELEQEIEKFRTENSTLAKLRREREEGLEQLKKEMMEFEKQKDGELKRLQEFKSDEMKKLKREKKQFEVYQQNMRAMPNKKEREEIETLKNQLSEFQDETKRKESRWNSSMTRLREKCESLTSENDELKEEIKILEKQRIAAWQKKDTAPKVKEESCAADVKPAPVQMRTSPIAESHLSRLPARDSHLRHSTNLDLNDSDLRAAAEPPTPHTSLIRLTDHPQLNRTGQVTGLPAPQSKPGATADGKKPIPRKRAVPQSITNTVDKGDEEYEEVQHPDGKVEKIYSNGAREIMFTNGTKKQISSDGQSIIVCFFNGDMKQILPDQRVVYYYADAKTTHTTYPDGLEILQFPNQQMEKHYPDGTKEITFPDQTIKYLFPDGVEESIYADGTVIRIEKSGHKTVEFPNGQREIHTDQFKRREYPDGTVKTVYPDGRQETRYSSGRVRVKDNFGNVIVDKRM